jgi:putative transposase
MPRIARVVAVGYPHHVTQRGNYGQTVFLDDGDREKYLMWMQEYSNKFGTSLLVYSLMTNHVHFIGIPDREDSLAKTFSAAHMRYSQYFNKKMGAKGHLWQGRFYSCVLDDNHLMAAAKYIERNPVRAKLVKKPWEWKWSSASIHIGRECNRIIEVKDLFGIIDIKKEEWKIYIDSEDNEEDIKEIKRLTMVGRPLGEEQFIKDLEQKFGRRIIALPIGRPKKEQIVEK